MFIGNMVTEAIPARVFALYKIVESKKGISRSELRGLMEPKEIYEGTSYFSAIMKAAEELKLIENKDNVVNLSDDMERLKTIEDFRRYVISILPDLSDGQFWRCTNIIVNMNEKIYEYSAIPDSNMLKYVSEKLGQTVNAPMIRGWRFWSQFLGFGLMNDMVFLPNAYVYLKDVLRLMNLEKKQEYTMSDFMARFMQYGRIMLPASTSEKNLNIAMSSALRELHDNGEIVLKSGSDQEMKWILYPSKELFNQPVSSVVYKGVKA
ncbi:hypothetical protein EBB54_20360 [Schaedlerella arabinosiphila]|uniref:DUF4007 family protein n=2 Tax=Schaedlerella arabinosiphila TaxID=2044587 RepID=A0A3R8KWM5_9FIRM|nr:hypothetical protein EBB54_20360 [Schaedlerella arabinosiphila]